jgi:hypothetical protein
MRKLAWRPPRIDYTIHIEYWVDALTALDQFGDKKPLCGFLRNCELSSEVGEYLADLIERRCVPLKKGRPRTPAYTLGDLNIQYLNALYNVEAYRQEGMSLDDALEEAANESGLSLTSLRLSHHGSHTSLRRSIKIKKP